MTPEQLQHGLRLLMNDDTQNAELDEQGTSAEVAQDTEATAEPVATDQPETEATAPEQAPKPKRARKPKPAPAAATDAAPTEATATEATPAEEGPGTTKSKSHALAHIERPFTDDTLILPVREGQRNHRRERSEGSVSMDIILAHPQGVTYARWKELATEANNSAPPLVRVTGGNAPPAIRWDLARGKVKVRYPDGEELTFPELQVREPPITPLVGDNGQLYNPLTHRADGTPILDEHGNPPRKGPDKPRKRRSKEEMAAARAAEAAAQAAESGTPEAPPAESTVDATNDTTNGGVNSEAA